VLPAVSVVLAMGLALLPLVSAQVNPTHIGWIDHSPLSTRIFETGVSFLAGETGHVIAEPPRERFAVIPAVLVGIALLLVALRGSPREKNGVGLGLAVGLGTVLLASAAVLVGKDYIVERNLLPALIPLTSAAGVAFATTGARRFGLVCAVLICAYWLAYDVYITRTANLQRPDFRDLTVQLGRARQPRAILTWKLAADPIRFYLDDTSRRAYRGTVPVREIDVVSKPVVARKPVGLPPGFRPVERRRLERLTLIRYVSAHLQQVPFQVLRDARTGFGRNAVIVDGPTPAEWRTR
jgi:hypothetical protein